MGSVNTGVLLDERYRVVGRRASGATATVWEAEDEFLRRRVAVKILHDHLATDADLRARFVDEARAAATVTHPALVAVYDSIVDQPGIVMEWIDGPDLRQRLDQGPIHPASVAEIGAIICGGLTALHHYGLIHRDVKPANILLTADGRPKLTDFGIATANAGDRTATGIVLGTAKYLAPEQVRGTMVDGRTDVFALAAVLYEALAGRPPWSRDGDLPTALARLEEDAPDLRRLQPHLPAALITTVMRGLSREPEDRWPSAAAFAEALEGRSTLPAPPERPPAARIDDTIAATVHGASRGVRRKRPIWPRALAFVVVTAITLLGWTLVSEIAGPNPPSTAGSGDARLVIADAAAFDPEGSGPPGEHSELATRAIDGSSDTAWITERYKSRDLGPKSGVGLVLSLGGVSDVTSVTIETTDSEDWAAEVYVSTGVTGAAATAITDFGAVRGSGTGLERTAELTLDERGDTIVIWLTDLGAGPVPIELSVAEVTIRGRP